MYVAIIMSLCVCFCECQVCDIIIGGLYHSAQVNTEEEEEVIVCVCVCVCVRERERESVCVCVCAVYHMYRFTRPVFLQLVGEGIDEDTCQLWQPLVKILTHYTKFSVALLYNYYTALSCPLLPLYMYIHVHVASSL